MIPSEIPLIGYKKILYTTGLREQSRFAFHHAASLSRAYQAQLTVFHVVPGDDEMDQRLLTYVDEKLWQQIKSSSLREVKQLLMERKRDNAAIVESVDSFCKENEQSMSENPLVTYNIVVEWGHPAEKILEYAENPGYELIIMGRRPFRTWSRIGQYLGGSCPKEQHSRDDCPGPQFMKCCFQNKKYLCRPFSYFSVNYFAKQESWI